MHSPARLAAIQKVAVSRAKYAMIVIAIQPQMVQRSAEFFGLWGVAIRLAAILGPLSYGAVTWATGGNHRLAILITGAFFVVSLAILAGVDEARGRRQVEGG